MPNTDNQFFLKRKHPQGKEVLWTNYFPTYCICPACGNKEWEQDSLVHEESNEVWVGSTKCLACKVVHVWDFKPDVPLEYQMLYLREDPPFDFDDYSQSDSGPSD